MYFQRLPESAEDWKGLSVTSWKLASKTATMTNESGLTYKRRLGLQNE